MTSHQLIPVLNVCHQHWSISLVIVVRSRSVSGLRSRSRTSSAHRVDHSGQEVEVALQLTGGRAYRQVDGAREDVQTPEWTTGTSLAHSIFSTTLHSAAISATTCGSASLGTHAVDGVTQVAENFRKSTGLLLDGALSVANIRAWGGIGGVDEEGNGGHNCEGLHYGCWWVWCKLVGSPD